MWNSPIFWYIPYYSIYPFPIFIYCFIPITPIFTNSLFTFCITTKRMRTGFRIILTTSVLRTQTVLSPVYFAGDLDETWPGSKMHRLDKSCGKDVGVGCVGSGLRTK